METPFLGELLIIFLKKLNELSVKRQDFAMVKCFLGRIICAFLSENARQFFYAIRQKALQGRQTCLFPSRLFNLWIQ